MQLFNQLLFVLVVITSLVSSEEPVGFWLTQNGDSVVELYKKSGCICGRVVWLENPTDSNGVAWKDVHNPDTLLRSREVMGLEVLNGFKYTGDARYKGGKIYDAKTGYTYSCTMWLKKAALKVRGYIGVPLLGKTQKWRRISSDIFYGKYKK